MGLRIDINAASGTILGGLAAAGGQFTVAGTAAAITLVPYVASKFMTRRQEIATSPVAFLLAADRDLTGRRLLNMRRGSWW
ncbi:hypothetical protein OG912_38840 (plasmid) [Streptomyces sp. NBC_00464]|uniref:hypothetical protein n=1 Tax=Streptomyces sp. NBC_00464 TaxID=2975751 RepID=UPI002E18DA18